MTYTINNLPTNRTSKSSAYALMGTVLSCAALFLIMWFYVMPYTTIAQPVEEEGLMISFGNNEDAGGMGSSSEPLAAPESEILTPVPTQQPTAKPAAKEQLITQNDNTNAIAMQKQKEIDRKEKLQIDKQKIESEQRIAQQKMKEQDAINKAATVNGLFSNGSQTSGSGNGKGSGNGTGSGSGNGSGEGIQGNPAGHGNLGGNSWSLNGRSLTGRLLSPNYDRDVEGKVTVNIRVDASGRVSSATIGSPTTISDAETRNAAITAANNTHFSSGNGTVSGVITYNFKLR